MKWEINPITKYMIRNALIKFKITWLLLIGRNNTCILLCLSNLYCIKLYIYIYIYMCVCVCVCVCVRAWLSECVLVFFTLNSNPVRPKIKENDSLIWNLQCRRLLHSLLQDQLSFWYHNIQFILFSPIYCEVF